MGGVIPTWATDFAQKETGGGAVRTAIAQLVSAFGDERTAPDPPEAACHRSARPPAPAGCETLTGTTSETMQASRHRRKAHRVGRRTPRAVPADFSYQGVRQTPVASLERSGRSNRTWDGG